MLWLNRHARHQSRLSSYIDGQLAPSDVAALELHLDSCEACHDELTELRAVRSAIARLPDVAAPRSFALTPAMLERPGPRPATSSSPIGTGMRLAGAAVAVALTVVVIGDLSGTGGGGRDELENTSATTVEPRADEEFSDGDAAKVEEGALPPAGTAAAEGNDTGMDEAVGGVIISTPAGTAAPSAPTPAPEVDQGLRDSEGEADSAEAVAAASDDGGVSVLTVLEIMLAGILVALVAGIIVDIAARRRRPG